MAVSKTTLFAILSVVLIFWDSRVFLRVFLGGYAEPAGLALGLLYVVLAMDFIFHAPRVHRKYCVYLLWFCFANLVRLAMAGYKWTVLIQMIGPYIALGVALIRSQDEGFIRAMCVALTVSMCINALIIISPTSMIIKGLDTQTAFGISVSGEAAIFSGRATGFTAAPGFLSLYASISLGIGLILLLSERYLLGAILFIVSVICGVASVNRSFILGAAISGLCAILMAHWSLRKAAVALLLVGVTGTYILTRTIYPQLIIERMDLDILETDFTDRMEGTTGNVDALKALMNHPFAGAAYADPLTDEVGVSDGESIITPHTGFVAVLSARGFLLGGIFLGGYGMAIWGLMKNSMRRRHKARDLTAEAIAAPALTGFLAGLAVCIVDPLLETGPMLVLTGIGLGMLLLRKN